MLQPGLVLLGRGVAEPFLGAIRQVQPRGAPGDDGEANARAGFGGEVLEGPVDGVCEK